jgi:sialate O-acetylesterase
MKKTFVPLFILFSFNAAFSQVKLPAFFTDSMVLQRNKPVAIWGWSSAKEKVSVSFSNQTKSTTADSSGKWAIWLDAMPANAAPQSIKISASNTITLQNVLVGDIWFCGGQSNMEYPLDRKLNKYAKPARGNDIGEDALTEPKQNAIRYLYVEKKLNAPGLPTKGWITGENQAVKAVSAIGYFFAKEIYEKTKVPVGIISSSWGGSRIEAWIPDWAYANSPVFKDSATAPDFKIDGMHPGQFYKGLVEPLFPFSVAGVLWYQGESDLLIHDHATYAAKFDLLVNTWRQLFKDASLPFYYVQIAPHYYTKRKDPLPHLPQALPEFWEVQSQCLHVPNTAMAVTTDLVDNLNDIHPSYKWIVAHRLALIAFAKYYGEKNVVFSGPVFEKAKIKKHSIELTFTNTGSGLKSGDGKPLSWFSVAGKNDSTFVPANAIIKNNKVIVSSDSVTDPMYVRFAWSEDAQPNLFNEEGLPASAFRTGK